METNEWHFGIEGDIRYSPTQGFDCNITFVLTIFDDKIRERQQKIAAESIPEIRINVTIKKQKQKQTSKQNQTKQANKERERAKKEREAYYKSIGQKK